MSNSSVIRKARPKLSVVSPLATRLIGGFGVFNVLLGLVLYQLRVGSTLILINNIFSFQFWGVIYALIGIAHLVSLKVNSWKGARYSLFAGVAIKSLFLAALVIQTLEHGAANLSILVIWAFLAYVQAMVYVFFSPTAESIENFEEKIGHE